MSIQMHIAAILLYAVAITADFADLRYGNFVSPMSIQMHIAAILLYAVAITADFADLRYGNFKMDLVFSGKP
ncbi:hypothetical protein CDAR_118991 [Caerostris darwini]|uniref:Uncharacterized protein n=1 Tax=Caerostris darwini TaxID=1538125 RepID=A0AAV4VA55_9ARAC|nr:hypothetical protein CDAR_118991 [Caerostris darwini]